MVFLVPRFIELLHPTLHIPVASSVTNQGFGPSDVSDKNLESLRAKPVSVPLDLHLPKLQIELAAHITKS